MHNFDSRDGPPVPGAHDCDSCYARVSATLQVLTPTFWMTQLVDRRGVEIV